MNHPLTLSLLTLREPPARVEVMVKMKRPVEGEVGLEVHEYLARIGSVGGRNGSREDKVKAALARAAKLGPSVARAAREAGVPVSTVRWRLRKGWGMERALGGKKVE